MKQKSDQKFTTDFTSGNVTRQLVIFASPLFLSSLLQIAYNMVDMIIVGQKLGKVGLSAVSVGGDVTSFLTLVAMGFSNAGQVIISQYLGSGRKEKISRFIGTMMSFLMGCAVIVSVLCLALRRQILTLMNTPPESFDEAMSYATICMIGMVFIYGYNIVSAVLRGLGDSVRPLIFIGISTVMNVILDIVFVLVMDLGSGGAALATVVSQGTSFALCCIYVYRYRERYELSLAREEMLGIDRVMLGNLVKLGVPMAIKFAAVHLSKLFVNAYVNSYGVAVSAFSGIANKINSITNLLSNSFNTSGASMIGQNIGAGKYERVGQVMKSIFSITIVIAIIFSLLIVFFPEKIYGAFTDDPEVIAIGYKYVPIAVLFFFGSSARSGMNALVNGSGNYKVNFATAILDGIVLRIGFAVLFGLILGMKHYGFWLGDALAGFTPLWIGLFFYYSGAWKKRSV